MDAKEVDVYSGRGGADCSYHFRLGETYFVTPYEDTGTLLATVRSDTQPAADSGPLISELRARRNGKPYTSLCGVLQRTQQPYSWAISGDHDHPLPGIAIELVCADHTFSTQTDSRGVYRFYGLPAHTYHIKATLPANLELAQTILSEPQPPITIPEGACYQQDIDALPTSRIVGRVIGPDGLPL